MYTTIYVLSGKTTQAQLLAQWLREHHRLEVLETREPGGSVLGEQLREIFLTKRGQGMTPITEVLLMFAARYEHLQQRIVPVLERGGWVICDRFTDSTVAYQGGGRGVEKSFIRDLANRIHADDWPNLTFYMQSPPARSSAPLISDESFESEAVDFYQRVYDAYQELAQHNKRIVVVRELKGKKRRSIEDIAIQIKESVSNQLMVPISD